MLASGGGNHAEQEVIQIIMAHLYYIPADSNDANFGELNFTKVRILHDINVTASTAIYS